MRVEAVFDAQRRADRADQPWGDEVGLAPRQGSDVDPSEARRRIDQPGGDDGPDRIQHARPLRYDHVVTDGGDAIAFDQDDRGLEWRPFACVDGRADDRRDEEQADHGASIRVPSSKSDTGYSPGLARS